MKRIIAAMAALALSVGCFAQDMIVKKDGSIIQAKVMKVGTTEVDYICVGQGTLVPDPLSKSFHVGQDRVGRRNFTSTLSRNRA